MRWRQRGAFPFERRAKASKPIEVNLTRSARPFEGMDNQQNQMVDLPLKQSGQTATRLGRTQPMKVGRLEHD